MCQHFCSHYNFFFCYQHDMIESPVRYYAPSRFPGQSAPGVGTTLYECVLHIMLYTLMFAQVQQEVGRGAGGPAPLQPSVSQELYVALADVGFHHFGSVSRSVDKTKVVTTAKYAKKEKKNEPKCRADVDGRIFSFLAKTAAVLHRTTIIAI